MRSEKNILAEYAEKRDMYIQMETYIFEILQKMMRDHRVMLMDLTHRLKTPESLSRKVIKKDKYSILADITDVIGFRLIAYFSDDVDKIAALVQDYFVMDWENTVDKTAALSPTAFGYSSLHYICSLPTTGEHADEYPAEYRGIRFEIQIRTSLQHVWAEIEHDLGYKSEFGVPREIRREFSRIAGLLEIADERFNTIRTNVQDYTLGIRTKIKEGLANDLLVDQVSLKEFMDNNRRMQEFMQEIAMNCNVCIEHVDSFPYLKHLEFLGIHTLGNLSYLLECNWHYTIRFTKDLLHNSDIDLISSNAVLRYLCYSEMIRSYYSDYEIEAFMALTATTKERAHQNAVSLINRRDRLAREANNPSMTRDVRNPALNYEEKKKPVV